jgi:hypothetical protein
VTSIFRIYPTFKTGALLVVREDQARIARAYATGKKLRRALVDADMDTQSLAELRDLGDFPCGVSFTPVVSARFRELLEPELRGVGRLFPIRINNVPQTEYCLLVVDLVVDCLDLKASSGVDATTGRVKRPVFVESRLPTAPAFRPKESPDVVLWSKWFVDALKENSLSGFECLLAWSSDPAEQPSPHAMG